MRDLGLGLSVYLNRDNGDVTPRLSLTLVYLFLPLISAAFCCNFSQWGGKKNPQIWRYHSCKWHLLLMWQQTASALICDVLTLFREGSDTALLFSRPKGQGRFFIQIINSTA